MAMFDPYFVTDRMNEVLARYGAGFQLKITPKEKVEIPPAKDDDPA